MRDNSNGGGNSARAARQRDSDVRGAARATPALVPFEEDVRAYDKLLDRYRTGAIEEAIGDLRKLVTAGNGQRQITRWIDGARAANRRADLQGVLLLITEAMMAIWATDDPFPFGRLAPYMIPFQRLHVELKEMDARTPFLKTWYLLWESFRHVHGNQPIPTELDFIACGAGRVSERLARAPRRRIAIRTGMVDVARERSARPGT